MKVISGRWLVVRDWFLVVGSWLLATKRRSAINYQPSTINAPFWTLLPILFLAACGFSPVYKSEQFDGKVKAALAATEVAAAGDSRDGQILRTELENLLHPAGASAPKYRLEVTLETLKEAQAVERTREVTRYKLAVTAHYALSETGGGKKVTAGKSRITGSYDTAASDFATFTVEGDTRARILKETARDIRFQLAGFFLK